MSTEQHATWAEIEAPLIAQGERDAELLRARLAEDETIARAATVGPWRTGTHVGRTLYAHGTQGVEKSGELIGTMDARADAAHVARHHPARVLDQCGSIRDALTDLERIAERGDPDSRAAARNAINNLRRIWEPDETGEAPPALNRAHIRENVYSNIAGCAIQLIHEPTGIVVSRKVERGGSRLQAREELLAELAGKVDAHLRAEEAS